MATARGLAFDTDLKVPCKFRRFSLSPYLLDEVFGMGIAGAYSFHGRLYRFNNTVVIAPRNNRSVIGHVRMSLVKKLNGEKVEW